MSPITPFENAGRIISSMSFKSGDPLADTLQENDEFMNSLNDMEGTDQQLKDLARMIDPKRIPELVTQLKSLKKTFSGPTRISDETAGGGGVGARSVDDLRIGRLADETDDGASEAVRKAKLDFTEWNIQNPSASNEARVIKLNEIAKDNQEVREQLLKEVLSLPNNPGGLAGIWKHITDNPKAYILLSISLGVMSYFIAMFIMKTEETYTITKIENFSEGLLSEKLIKITYEPEMTISVDDTIDVSDSDSDPRINGTNTVVKYFSDTQIAININETLKTDGSKGTFRVGSSFIRTLSNGLGLAAANIITPIARAGSGIVGDTTSSLFGNFFLWLFIGIIILIILGVVATRFMKSSPSKTN